MIFPIEIINRILIYSDNIYAYFTFGLNDIKILNNIIIRSNGTIPMLKKAIEGSHTEIIDWILQNKIHISPKILLAFTIFAKDTNIIDYILKKIPCTSYDLCYLQILYLKFGRFDLFKYLNSIYPIPYFYLITIQPFSFIDKKMSALNLSDDKTESLFFPSSSIDNINVTSLPELSNNHNNANELKTLKQKNKLYISQLAQDLIEALYLFTIQNKQYDRLTENEKLIIIEYFKIIASFYSYDPWNYRPWKRDDNGWYIMFNSLIVFFIKNKMYHVLDKIDDLRQCLDNDINRSLFLCKGIKLELKDIVSMKKEYHQILEKEYCILNGEIYQNIKPQTKYDKNNTIIKSDQNMNIDIFFGSIINKQLHILKNYFNLDVYNFETFLYYYLDRVTDINIMIDNTITNNFQEFLDTLCQLPIPAIFQQSQDSKLYIYELIQSMITECLKKCNYKYIDYIIDNILIKYNISRYNLECCFNDAFYSNCSYEVMNIMKHLIKRLYDQYIQKQKEKNSNNNIIDSNDTETVGENTNEYENNEDELFGFAPYNLKINLGCISETIIVKNYNLSQFNIFKKYEDLIWPLIIGQHHWLNNSADLMSLLSYLLLKINTDSDLYDQYLSLIVDMYKPNTNDTKEFNSTNLLQNIIVSSEKKTFMYLSDINPNNIIYLANKLNVDKYKFYTFFYIRFNNSNPFLTFKKMFQSNTNRNSTERSIFNKYNHPLSSEECERIYNNFNNKSDINNNNNYNTISKNLNTSSLVTKEDISSHVNKLNHGQIESNTRQNYPYNSKFSKSDNSIELIQSSTISKSISTKSPNNNESSSSSSSSSNQNEKPKKINYNKTIKTYLNNKKYRNINVYEFKEIFKESSEWKEIFITINNNKEFNNNNNNKNEKIDNKYINCSMLDLFSLIYDI
ncbi:hypothetical protein BCR32DRAFT_265700 [Anaeromyces robustus]|uniref:Uncharacterized protein n=1 Tax=Anaeromyces robustus TaxID=1754192 RepID=A0A1Y1XJ43_9FUNG|nr:hypothetical protein BCR32DRAFT_265700 [Anaeromyces robustus]|eukprot:ORX85426.1 hypothetical protein BCR32DRAFT_265700 [Anaeromyces robustus]